MVSDLSYLARLAIAISLLFTLSVLSVFVWIYVSTYVHPWLGLPCFYLTVFLSIIVVATIMQGGES